MSPPRPHLLPADEATELQIKLHYTKRLQRDWKDGWTEYTGLPMSVSEYKPLSPIAIATMMMMNLKTIKMVFQTESFDRGSEKQLLRCLMVVPCFIKAVMMIQRPEVNDNRSEDKDGQGENSEGMHKPGGGEIEKADRYDLLQRRKIDGGRCIILGTGTGGIRTNVCHILPASINSTEESRLRFWKYLSPALNCFYHIDDMPKWVDGPPDTDIAFMYEEEESYDLVELDEKDEDEKDEDEEDGKVHVFLPPERPTPTELFTFLCRKNFASKVGVSNEYWNQEELEILDDSSLVSEVKSGAGHDLKRDAKSNVDGYLKNEKKGTPGTTTTIYTRIKLQWHWMPRATPDTPLGISQQTKVNDIIGRMNRTYGYPNDEIDDPLFAQGGTHQNIPLPKTGDIFYAKVKPHHAERMLASFQIKWAAVKIYSLAGGPEALRDVGDHPEYLDENLNNWIGHKRMGLTIPQLLEEAEEYDLLRRRR